jgi:hypothetical protein
VGLPVPPGGTHEAEAAAGAVNLNQPGHRLAGLPDRLLRRHYGWNIELFFRFFKHVLGCRHLVSRDPAGLQIQAYCAIIACLLIHLWTGGRPTLRSYEMICFYLSGWADLDELTAHLEKLAAAQKPH